MVETIATNRNRAECPERWRVHERANPTYVILPSKVASAKS
jgi:hypothetical protein